MADGGWGNDPVQSMGMSETDAHALFDKTFGAGKWKLTGGYRSGARENELRSEGAETVPPGHTSAHSEGTPDAPGAYDIAVDGLTPKEAAAKLEKSGAKFAKLLPEGASGTQGGHLHVAPLPELHDDWGNDPVQKAPAQATPPTEAPPKPKRKTPLQQAQDLAGREVDQFGHIVAEGARQNAAAGEKLRADLSGKNAPKTAPTTFGGMLQEGVREATEPLTILSDALGAGGGGFLSGLTKAGLGEPVSNTLAALTGGRVKLDPQATGDVLSAVIPGVGEVAGERALASRAATAGVGSEALRGAEAGRPAAQAARLQSEPPRPQNALQRIMRPQSPQEQAENIVARKIYKESGRAPTAQEMLDHADRTPEKPLTLMDVGGPRVRGLAGSVVRNPKGEGGATIENFLTGRSEMQGPRLESDVQRQIGAGSSRQTIRSLQQAQKEAADPLYEEAREANPVIRSSVIDQIVRSPQGAPLWKEAISRARARVVGTDKPIPDKYSLATMDQLKRLFDDKISVAKRAGENDTVSFYKGMKNRLIAEVDANDKTGGAYKKARQTFSDRATSQEAVEFGRGALKMNAEDIDDHFRGLSDGDKELARLGLGEALRDKIRATNVGRNAAINLARNRTLQDQIAPFFRTFKDAQKFVDSVTAEDTMFRTDNEVTKGSQTAARHAEDSTEDARVIGHAARGAVDLARGNVLGALARGGRAAYDVATRPNPEVGARVADILTQPVSSNSLARAMLERGPPRAAPRNYLQSVDRRLARRAVPAIAASSSPPQQ